MSSDLVDRSDASLKEAAVTEEQQRSASVTLADIALIAADGDTQAAKEMLPDLLEAIGTLHYEPPALPKSSRMRPIVNYGRPGA